MSEINDIETPKAESSDEALFYSTLLSMKDLFSKLPETFTEEEILAAKEFATNTLSENRDLYTEKEIDRYTNDPELFHVDNFVFSIMAYRSTALTDKGHDMVFEMAEVSRKRIKILYGYDIVENLLRDQGQTDPQQDLPRITISKNGAKNADYPLDKVNNNVWDDIAGANKTGQLEMGFATEPRGKRATVIYGINFDELEADSNINITKKLTAFDKRCYIAANALYNAGYDTMTASQIYHMMGNQRRPSKNDIRKINESLTKMRAAKIYISNKIETSIYENYKLFEYDGDLLPMERVSAIVNGQVTESAIHLFREPPLISFARDRKQITTIPRKVLESPISQTDQTLKIEDYLIERISRINHGGTKNKITYKTLFDKAGISSRNQRTRSKEKITTLLKHYKEIGFIKDFEELPDGITINPKAKNGQPVEDGSERTGEDKC